ncbi:MAG: hypothetical protein NMNS01_04100 [Nitrosomonas sp.]|nr:MAG: hypothetical protein NMNS01_04100 [Nitrosomonas sp.]
MQVTIGSGDQCEGVQNSMSTCKLSNALRLLSRDILIALCYGLSPGECGLVQGATEMPDWGFTEGHVDRLWTDLMRFRCVGPE